MSRSWKWLTIVLLAGCQAQSAKPTATTPTPEHPAVAESMSLLAEGKLTEGLERLSQAIDQQPDDCRLFGARATLHHRAGLNSQALDDLNRALEISPKDPQLLNNRGFILLSLQRLNDAVRDFERALELKPGMASACNNRGLAELAEGHYDNALAWFTDALADQPTYVDALNNRGFAWMQLGNLENAYADLNQALRISPKYVNALHNRGLLKARAGEVADAVLDFTDAMMIDPKNPRYYQHRSEAYVLLGQTAEAAADVRMRDWLVQLETLNRDVAAEPKLASAWVRRARHYWDRGDEAPARSDLQKALELDPQFSAALVLRGRVALADQQFEEAVRICELALETDDAAAAASVRGDAFLALGKYDQALESFAAAKRFDASVAAAYFHKSQELAGRGDAEAAQVQLDLALELDPDVERRLR